MLLTRITLGGLAALAFAASGCSESADTAATAKPSAAGAAYLAKAEPADAKGVGEARKAVEDGDEVTLVGRIGGGVEPFVNGLAAFTIVDPAVPYCAADEGCPTPWDYCCQTDQLPANTATVKLVGNDGKAVAEDARQLLGVKELNVVVVRGKAKRDDAGNLTVLAEEVFVRPDGATPAAKGDHHHEHGDGDDHEGEHDHDHDHGEHEHQGEHDDAPEKA